MAESLAVVAVPSFESLEALVVNTVRSAHSKRAYQGALRDFLRWYQASGQGGLNKALVQQYRAELENLGLGSSSINLRLSVVRRLAVEAADNGLLAPELAAGISRVKGAKSAGVRTGHWLTRDQAEALLQAPDPSTRAGKRDRLILALLVGCGLRREELARLNVEDIQQREGRWVIADLVGKGNRVRTVPMPAWAKPLLDAWMEAAGLTGGRVLRPVNKADRVTGPSMTSQAIFNIVTGYAAELGYQIAPHDLRRSFAKLAHRGRAELQQIQLSLGHASVKTTEIYLGLRQDLTDAPCDHLGLRVNAD